MATVINNPGESSDSSGWAVAVIILLIVIAGGAYAWFRYHRAAAPGDTNINVTLPTGTQDNGGAAQ